MAGPGSIGDVHVDVGVNTRLAEEGIKRLQVSYDRTLSAMSRRKAEAKITADITDVDRKISEVKLRMAELSKEQADPSVELDDNKAKAEMAALKLELKALGAEKLSIQVDSKELREANKLLDLSARKQAEMAKQWDRTQRAERDAIRNRQNDEVALLQRTADRLRLEEKFVELGSIRKRQEREGMFTLGGFPGRTKQEERDLERTIADMSVLEAKIRQLGGDTSNLGTRANFGSKIADWASNLKNLRLNIGPVSARLNVFIAAVTTLGPLILSLTGALSALIGVLGAGLVGAASVGGAALGGFATSLIGVVLAAKGFLSPVMAASKAMEKVHADVVKYGRGSTEAKKAQEELNHTMSSMGPAARLAARGFATLKSDFAAAVAPGRQSFFEAINAGLKTAHKLLPDFGRQTVATMKVASNAIQGVFRDLRSSGFETLINDLMGNFRKALPNLIDGLDNMAEALGNMAQEGSKFLPSVTAGFDHWMKAFANETATESFKRKLDVMIHDAGDLLHLFRVAGEAVVLFFGAGAQAGDGMVESLSHTIERWNDWMKSVEGSRSLHDFFQQSAKDTSNFFGALVPLIATFVKLTYALQPVSSGVLWFANALGKVVTWITKFAPLRPMLEALGVTLGVLWTVNKVKGYAEALSGVYGWLRKLLGGQAAEAEATVAANDTKIASYDALAAAAGDAAAAQEAAGTAGVAGAATGGVAAGAATAEATTAAEAASGGLAASISSGLGLAVVGAAGVLGGLFATEFAHSVSKHIGAGEFGTERQSVLTALTHGFNTSGVMETERAKLKGIKKAISPEDVERLERIWHGFLHNINADSVLGMGKIREDMTRGLQVVNAEFIKYTPQWRAHTAKALHASIEAIEKGMAEGRISVTKGGEEIKRLLGQIHMIRGEDPLGVARGAFSSFKHAGEVTETGVARLLHHLAQLPPHAQQIAGESILKMTERWAQGRPKLEAQVDGLANKLETRFGITRRTIQEVIGKMVVGLGRDFGSLGTVTATVMKDMGINVNSALKAFGLNKKVSIGIVNAAGSVAANLLGFGAEGGEINRPMFVVGEEAPQHPEYVIATNPAYKQDNVGYWVQAGQALGMLPGRRQGGPLHFMGIEAPGVLGSLGNAADRMVYNAAQLFLGHNKPHASMASIAGISGSVASIFAQVAKRLHAPRAADMALFEAGLQESGLRNINYGDGTSTGALQVTAETARSMGIDPMNPAQVAYAFMTRGFYGNGGAIHIANRNPGLNPGTIAQMVQGSAYPSAYAPHAAQADALLRKYGLRKGGRLNFMAQIGSGRGYVNPFSHTKNLGWSRTDQGVDFTGEGPISAIGDANILSTGAPGWPEGGGVLYELTEGPAKGKVIYVYEGVNAAVRRGQHVEAGQTIAHFRPGGSIEMGYADTSGVPLSHAGYHEGEETGAGKAFKGWLRHILGGGSWSGSGKAATGGAGHKPRHHGPKPGTTGAGGGTYGPYATPKEARDVRQAPLKPSAAQGAYQELPPYFQGLATLPGLGYAGRIAIGSAAYALAESTKGNEDDKKVARYMLSLLKPRKKHIKEEIKRIRHELQTQNLTKAGIAHRKKRLNELVGELGGIQGEINNWRGILNAPPESEEEEAAEGAGGPTEAPKGEQLASYMRGRYELFNQFASNIIPTGRSLMSAGLGFAGGIVTGHEAPMWGGFSMTNFNPYSYPVVTSKHGKETVTVINNFAAPPPDPHTWTQQQSFELRTL